MELWMLNMIVHPHLFGRGHQWTVPTNTGYMQWLSLVKSTLKSTPACRKGPLVTHTSKCGWAMKLYNYSFRALATKSVDL